MENRDTKDATKGNRCVYKIVQLIMYGINELLDAILIENCSVQG